MISFSGTATADARSHAGTKQDDDAVSAIDAVALRNDTGAEAVNLDRLFRQDAGSVPRKRWSEIHLNDDERAACDKFLERYPGVSKMQLARVALKLLIEKEL